MGAHIAKLRVTRKHGKWGLFALEPIRRDATIIDLRDEELLSTPTRRSVQIDEGHHVIGREETIGYLNHSCEPNTWIDVLEMCVRALRDIEEGEELTFNYLATEYEMYNSFHCDCGSARCFGTIRGFKYLTHEQQLALKSYLAPYLKAKLNHGAG